MRAVRCRRLLVALLCLTSTPVAAKSLELWRDWSVAAFGGLKEAEVWHVGGQLFTARGPGDSGWIMSHHGFGIDLSYAHLGPGDHHLRPLAMGELMLYWIFVQAGVGPDLDLGRSGKSPGVDLMAAVGLRLYLHDEYQGPSISIGGRFDWIAGKRDVVPSFNARIGLPFEIR